MVQLSKSTHGKNHILSKTTQGKIHIKFILRSNADNGIPLVAANVIKKTQRKRSNTPDSHASLVIQAQSNIVSN